VIEVDIWVNVGMDIASAGVEGGGGEVQVGLYTAGILIVVEAGGERTVMHPLMTPMVVADIIEDEEVRAANLAEVIEEGEGLGLDHCQGPDHGSDPVVMTAKIEEDLVVMNLIGDHAVGETEKVVAIDDHRGEGNDQEVIVGVMIARENVVDHHRHQLIVMEDLPVGIVVVILEALVRLMTGCMAMVVS